MDLGLYKCLCCSLFGKCGRQPGFLLFSDVGVVFVHCYILQAYFILFLIQNICQITSLHKRVKVQYKFVAKWQSYALTSLTGSGKKQAYR